MRFELMSSRWQRGTLTRLCYEGIWQDQRESNPHLVVRSHIFSPLDYDPISRLAFCFEFAIQIF